MAATYTRLNSGEWGVRVTGEPVAEGDEVTVTRKDGQARKEIVTKVIWAGGGVTLCAIRREGERPGRARRDDAPPHGDADVPF